MLQSYEKKERKQNKFIFFAKRRQLWVIVGIVERTRDGGINIKFNISNAKFNFSNVKFNFGNAKFNFSNVK